MNYLWLGIALTRSTAAFTPNAVTLTPSHLNAMPNKNLDAMVHPTQRLEALTPPPRALSILMAPWRVTLTLTPCIFHVSKIFFRAHSASSWGIERNSYPLLDMRGLDQARFCLHDCLVGDHHWCWILISPPVLWRGLLCFKCPQLIWSLWSYYEPGFLRTYTNSYFPR